MAVQHRFEVLQFPGISIQSSARRCDLAVNEQVHDGCRLSRERAGDGRHVGERVPVGGGQESKKVVEL
jgi:hypothetical protein